MTPFDLKGKLAIVTGASQGLGKGIAMGLAKAGSDVVIIDRKKNEETVKEIELLGVRCESIEFDLSQVEKFDQLVNNIYQKYGHIDILVNNAGVQKRHRSVEFPKEDWDFVISINMNAVFFLCQSVAKIMLKQGSGKIINMASLLSFQGGYTVPAYTASKSAVMGFTKALANEWAEQGVNVNCIAPGYMATSMNTALIEDETRNRQIMERIPAGRWGTPEDLAGAAVFLASSASDYIHGQTIV
ncbi:2-dehydro-3-deoxy-D-gluconate 5-dehydrogenase KduD, partial [Bacillus cereus]|uniref:2-dehydro-3-deoxy-D-gluconate 5-dehydrogenase KduD n=1 Tax=Bacillus cereus TaxID=1396 RepID=UPI00367305D2